MHIVIKMEVVLPAGLTEDDVKARWTRNKVTAQVAMLIEGSAIGSVVKIDTLEVYETSERRESHIRS